MSYKRSCLMCGTEYEYCPYCRQFDRQPKWRTLFDREECKKLHDVTSHYLINDLSKEEAMKKISAIDLKDVKLTSPVQKVVDEIMQVSTEELKEFHDLVDESDEVMDVVKNVQPVLKKDNVFEKAEDKKKQVAKMKPVSTVKSVVPDRRTVK